MRRERELVVANRSHSRSSDLLRGAKSYKCTKMSGKNSVTNANHPTNKVLVILKVYSKKQTESFGDSEQNSLPLYGPAGGGEDFAVACVDEYFYIGRNCKNILERKVE